ncbi:uncharacterized protein LOC131846275 [Achroia grisella]|uniref:uncharacterized protein LOC131846275 n=1 Tax=Achroia grisella TaxID=688607 RepID=UPI0027D2888F|nr:uncharacterized protein LOC131846275 [Achroia grisella]
MNILRKLYNLSSPGVYRNFSLSSSNNASYSCKLLVVGGGSGGCTIAAKFARRLKKDAVIVLEPSSDHYYQPLFTLVGAGVTKVADTRKLEGSVLPTNAKWIKDSADCIDPEKGFVTTREGHVINYEYIVIAVGLQNDYAKVPGLSEALEDNNSCVSTIFAPQYCGNTWRDLQKFNGGDAIFTYPDSLIKCPGAPQKIVYLAESYFTKTNVRSKSNVIYNTCLPVIFGVKKYADALLKVVERKQIKVNYRTVLKEVHHDRKEAVFVNADDKTKETTMQYNLLHVAGYRVSTNISSDLTVTILPNNNHGLACPLLTSYSTCILAEFLYDGVPRETLPFDQARESTLAFYMKKDLFPFLYWNLMLKGYYHGPEFIRKIINPFAKMGIIFNNLRHCGRTLRYYSNVVPCTNEYKCKLLVVGGGTAGCSVAWRFSRKLYNDDIIVLEPSKVHYYQPLFTLIAAGIRQYGQCQRPTKSVLPPRVRWLEDCAEDFDPCNCIVHTKNGHKIRYKYMVIGVGLKNDYHKIPGLVRALNYHNSGVSTIYSPAHCVKTWCCLSRFKGGHAIFTFPNSGTKCSGAAQKIMYLADDYWRQHNIRHLTNITYNTGGEAIFGVSKYADALTKVAGCRNITVNCCTNLVEVSEDGAVFENLAGKSITLPYNLLHVTPPMSPPACLMRCEDLITEKGYLDVDKYTLQHTKYANIYGVGDCANTPNSKTAAAVAGQSHVVELNLLNTMEGKELTARYNGYGACPMLTSYNTGILAEFLYDRRLCETFPFDQSKERRLFYYMKKHLFPFLYWNRLIKGKWDGPAALRKMINPFGR